MNVLIGILIIVAIIILIILGKLVFDLIKTVRSIRAVVDDNKRNIDIIIIEASRNLEETTKLLKTINMKERELRETMDNVETITNDVAHVTTTVATTLKKSEEILDTVTVALHNFNNISNIFNKGDKNEKSN